MLIGHTFKEQKFANEAFRLFQDVFLNKNSGVIFGCALSNTNNTVTVGEGFFCIKGGFLQELGGTTLNVTSNGYYSLVCEIDLTKANTATDFLQGSYKLLQGTSSYPALIQEDITMGGGKKYQFEFARFQFNGNITNFIDRRTFLNFNSIYDDVNKKVTDAINSIIDGTAFFPKTGGTVNGDVQVIGKFIGNRINATNNDNIANNAR